jgi:branched-chain amino acid transport system substrate-binding protein
MTVVRNERRLPSSARWTRRAALAAAASLIAASTRAQSQDLVIGHVGPFTGLPSPNATDLVAGATAVIDQVNASGGIRGRKISLFTLDDQFTGRVFAERFKQAMVRRPLALLSPIGSDALGWLLKEKALDAADVVVLNAVPGADAFRSPGHPRLFHIRAGDTAQLWYIAQHCRTIGLRKVLVLHQNLAVGAAAVAGLRAAAASMGDLEITATQAAHDPLALKQAADRAMNADVQATVLAGAPRFMADALVALKAAGYKRARFALSYLPAPLAASAAGLDGARGLAITQAFPNPNGLNLPLQRDFQAAMRRSGSGLGEFTPLQLEGYITARVLVAALRHLKGSPTPDSLAAALHEMGAQDLGGFRVDFSRDNFGSNWVDVGVMSASGKLLY